MSDEEVRSSAKLRGDTKYLSEIGCRNGHLGDRYVRNNGCVECAKSHAKAKCDAERKTKAERKGLELFPMARFVAGRCQSGSA